MCQLLPALILLCAAAQSNIFSVALSRHENGKPSNHKFSAAPSGLPARKVTLLGKEVQLRQMFVDPIRPATRNGSLSKSAKLADPKKAILGCQLRRRRRRRQSGCFGCGGGCGGCGCGNGGCGGNWCGGNCGARGSCSPLHQQRPQPLPQPLPQAQPTAPPTAPRPPLPAPAPPTAQQYNIQQLSDALPQLIPGSTLSLSNQGGKISYKIIPPPGQQKPAEPPAPPLQSAQAQPPAVWQRQGEVSPSEKSSEAESEYSAEEAAAADDLSKAQPPLLGHQPKKSYDHVLGQGYPKPPPPPPPVYATQPSKVGSYAKPRPPPPPPPPPSPPQPKYVSPFPLPECYIDSSNFMCCNAQLEETLNQAYDSLVNGNPAFHRCNVQKIATTIQQFAERRFNTSFESVVGLGDYSSKSHFFHNYICKIERDNRYIMAYATPRWDLEGQTEAEEVPPQPQPQPQSYQISPNPQYVNYKSQPNRRWNNYVHHWR